MINSLGRPRNEAKLRLIEYIDCICLDNRHLGMSVVPVPGEFGIAITCVLFSIQAHAYPGKEELSRSDKRLTFTNLDGEYILTKYQTWKNQIDSLHMCLDALNLTDYYRELGYLETAEMNVVETLENYLRLIKPNHVVKTRHNYCYHVQAQLNVNSTHLSGFVDSFSFEVTSSTMDSFVLRSIHLKFETKSRSFTYACLPKVFLAGFPKCGSTFLNNILKSHPYVAKAAVKEPHQWDKVPASSFEFEKLTAYFALYMYNYSPTLDIKKSQPQISTDASPHTVFDWPKFQTDDNWRINVCLPPVVLPALIPKLQFIIIMRNPISAAYSRFWFSCTRLNGTVPEELLKFGPDIFHDRVATKISAFTKCQEDFPLAKCMMDTSENRTQSEKNYSKETERCGTANLGEYMYYFHVQRWLAVYPRKQFLFLTLEELSGSNRNNAMERVWRFIGVTRKYKVRQHFFHPSNEQQKVDYHHDPHLSMRQDTRVMLEHFYQPFNEQLSELLQDNKTLWTK